jgi:hypothetical protein
LTDATEQVEKQIIVMRLAVSIYSMSDHQLPSLLEALEQSAGRTAKNRQLRGGWIIQPIKTI